VTVSVKIVKFETPRQVYLKLVAKDDFYVLSMIPSEAIWAQPVGYLC